MEAATCHSCGESGESGTGAVHGAPPPQLRILCLHGYRQSASALRSRLCQLQRKIRTLAQLEFVQAPHPTDDGRHASGGGGRSCWLHAREGSGAEREESDHAAVWGQTEGWDQTEGWEATVATLTRALDEHGPFDGVLGLSQGAAVAAALVASRGSPRLRFVILCAGYVPSAPTALKALHDAAPIRCPSLHIVGTADAVVAPSASMQLFELFDSESRQLVQHDGGHILPAVDKHVARYRSFLQSLQPLAHT